MGVAYHRIKLATVVDGVDLPAGGEVHLPRFAGDLLDDGEGACPLGCQLACAHL